MSTSPDTQATPAPATLPSITGHVFTRQNGGYHRGEVDDFIRGLFRRISDLEHQLLPGAGRLAGDAARVTETALTSPQAAKMVADLLQMATDEAMGQRAQAARNAEQLLGDARAEAARILASAREQADGMATGARQQANTVIEGARATGKKTTDDADSRAAAVREGAGRRLDAMTGMHAETLRRVAQMRDLLDKILQGEEERGPLEGEVERVLGAVDAAAGLVAKPAVAAEGA